MKKLLFVAASIAALTASTPASAARWLFTITNVGGEDRGDFSFELDMNRAPDTVLSDTIRFSPPPFGPAPIRVTYTDVPGAGSGVVDTGLTVFTNFQQGGLSLLPLPFPNNSRQFRLINTNLIENSAFDRNLPASQNLPIFRTGTFAISTTPQNNGPRPFDNYQITIAVVPEPASWAMMILGFGAIGYAVRRRTVRMVLA